MRNQMKRGRKIILTALFIFMSFFALRISDANGQSFEDLINENRAGLESHMKKSRNESGCFARAIDCFDNRDQNLRATDLNDFLETLFTEKKSCSELSEICRGKIYMSVPCMGEEEDYYAFHISKRCLDNFYDSPAEREDHLSLWLKIIEAKNPDKDILHILSKRSEFPNTSIPETPNSTLTGNEQPETADGTVVLPEPAPTEGSGSSGYPRQPDTESENSAPTVPPTMTHTPTNTPPPTNTVTPIPPTETASPTVQPTATTTSGNIFDQGIENIFTIFGLVALIGAIAWAILKRRKRRSSRRTRRKPGAPTPAATVSQPNEWRTLELDDWVATDPKTMELGSMNPFLKFSFGNMQHQGRRDYQEDSFGFSDLSDPELVAKRGILAIVADGMGGLQNGKSISERAIQKFRKSFVKFSPAGDIPRQMLALVTETNRDIYETDKQKGGTTLLCVYIYHNSMYWVSVGDSAIYLFRRGRIYQLNKEHNRLNDLYLRFMYREMTREQVMAEPSLQGLTSNIGRRELREVDRNLIELRLQTGDRILLCTDGVSGRLTEKELLVAMSQRDAQACADAMKRMILKKNAPKQDNFTAEVIFCD